MNRFSIDTNLLVYTHNIQNSYHALAYDFMQNALAGEYGQLCIPIQVFIEFTNTITSNRVEAPLSIAQTIEIITFYLTQNINIIYYQPNHMETWLELLKIQPSRKKLFDTSLASTLKSNHITTLYTVNVKDFQNFDFLTVINPLTF